MAFKWKDRDGAVNQAAYQFIESRKRVLEFINAMTPEEIAEQREAMGNPKWEPTFNERDTYLDCMDLVLGTGSKFKNYFCLDPESITTRQWTQFKNAVMKEVLNRDYRAKELRFLEEMLKEKTHASSSREL